MAHRTRCQGATRERDEKFKTTGIPADVPAWHQLVDGNADAAHCGRHRGEHTRWPVVRESGRVLDTTRQTLTNDVSARVALGVRAVGPSVAQAARGRRDPRRRQGAPSDQAAPTSP